MTAGGRSWGGCAVPADLLYDLEADVWVRPMDGRLVLGMTDIAQTRCGRLVQVSWKAPGTRALRGRPLCVIESAKWVGPFRSPVSGTIEANNAASFEADVAVANRDPYGAGWLVAISPSAWDAEQALLADGDEAWEHYRRVIDAEDIRCFRCAE